MESAQSYGAGMAGGAFDPLAFIKRPQVILRIVSWVRSIFFCLSLISQPLGTKGNCLDWACFYFVC